MANRKSMVERDPTQENEKTKKRPESHTLNPARSSHTILKIPMYYLLHHQNTYQLYSSLRRLCRENGIDPEKLTKDQLPAITPKGRIIAITPDERI